MCGAIDRWTVLHPATPVTIAVPRHPAVAEVNANGFTMATVMEKCRIDSSTMVGTCRTKTTYDITTTSMQTACNDNLTPGCLARNVVFIFKSRGPKTSHIPYQGCDIRRFEGDRIWRLFCVEYRLDVVTWLKRKLCTMGSQEVQEGHTNHELESDGLTLIAVVYTDSPNTDLQRYLLVSARQGMGFLYGTGVQTVSGAHRKPQMMQM